MKLLIFVVCLLCLGCATAHRDPHHVILSLTGNSDSLQVTFTTKKQPETPLAQYWIADQGPKGAVTIYGNENSTFAFQNPNSTTIDYITTFTLTNLQRATFYTYIVCGDAKDLNDSCSANFTFKSLPNDGDAVNIVFFGDLGSNGTAIMQSGPGGLIQYAQSYAADFIVHNGDLAYNLATNGGVNGNDFLDKIEPITNIIPYVVTPGNHEFKEYGDPIYYSNWFMGQKGLGEQSGSVNPTMWSSFDVNNVHIIAMSTEVFCADPSNLMVQHQWLENDLQSVRKRAVQPFVVVFGHRQMYIGPISTYSSKLMRLGVQCNDSSLQHCSGIPCDTGVNCGYSLELLLDKYNVDIFISGHVHKYVRMFPISPSLSYERQSSSLYLNSQHPTYLISGAAGNQVEYAAEAADIPLLNVAKFVDKGYSFSHMQVFNSSCVYFKQIDVSTGDIVDDFWIVKDSSKPIWDKTEKFILAPNPETQCD